MEEALLSTSRPPPRPVLPHFIAMSLLYSANHGCLVSCLSFATYLSGQQAAYPLAVLHMIYALSSLSGLTTSIVKRWGAKMSLMWGMMAYVLYIGLFWWSFFTTTSSSSSSSSQSDVALSWGMLGAVLGGLGGSLCWCGQGTYFAQCAELYGKSNTAPADSNTEAAASLLAGIFAFIYLLEEVVCKLLSSFVLMYNAKDGDKDCWNWVLGLYVLVALLSTCGMAWVRDFTPLEQQTQTNVDNTTTDVQQQQARQQQPSVLCCWHEDSKAAAAWRLLRYDTKMKYLVGLNAVFGFAGPFVNSHVNGRVVRHVLHNESAVGILSALSSAVAAACSLLFGYFTATHKRSSGRVVLTIGSLAFSLVALPFLLLTSTRQFQPHGHQHSWWNWLALVPVYCFQGIGRSTFEGQLRASFANMFPHEKEGAFANIVLQNGIFTAMGFALTVAVPCWSSSGPFCVGGRHNMMVIELLILVSAIAAIAGYAKAESIHRRELSDHGGEDDASTYLTVAENENDTMTCEDISCLGNSEATTDDDRILR